VGLLYLLPFTLYLDTRVKFSVQVYKDQFFFLLSEIIMHQNSIVKQTGDNYNYESNQQYATLFFLLWRCDPTRVMASSFLRFLGHTQRRTTACRTPLDEWSARRRDLYLTTHNTHNRQTSMPPVGFEPTISAGERPQTYALDRAATGTGIQLYRLIYYS